MYTLMKMKTLEKLAKEKGFTKDELLDYKKTLGLKLKIELKIIYYILKKMNE